MPCRGGPFPGALMVSMMENAPPLAAGAMRTMRSSPIAGIVIGRIRAFGMNKGYAHCPTFGPRSRARIAGRGFARQQAPASFAMLAILAGPTDANAWEALMVKIAILDDWQDVARSSADWSRLAARAELSFSLTLSASEDEAALALEDFDILLTMRERTAFPESLIRRLPKLRMIGITGASNASLDVEACTRQGVTVCNTPAARRSLRDGGAGAWTDDRRRARDSRRRQDHARRRLPTWRACGHRPRRQNARNRWRSAASGRVSPAMRSRSI